LRKIKVFNGGDAPILEKFVNKFLAEQNFTKASDYKLYYSTAYREEGKIFHSVLIEYDES